VLKCLIIASAYCSARLIGGGKIVTGNYYNFNDLIKNTGPLLNPGIALGQMIVSGELTWFLQYVVTPFGGSILSMVFFDYVYLPFQEITTEVEKVEKE
jgi:hypothetical protein